MALFGRKKNEDDTAQELNGQPEGETAEFQPNPEKAKAFFDRARTVHETTKYDYAMTLWLQGLRLDPTDLTALEGFYRSGGEFSSRQAKAKGPTKEQRSSFSGKGPLEKYLLALLEWGARPLEWRQGMDALRAAVKLGIDEPAAWIGARVLGLAYEDPRTKKGDFVALMEIFRDIEAYDMAVRAGEAAVARDPTDAKLEAEVRNMSAQATMTRAGYEDTGKQGGFRKNIRDLGKQTALEEEERIVKSEAQMDSILERVRQEYEARPTDSSAVKRFAKFLLERGTPSDEKLAHTILMRAYQEIGAYEYRKLAGDIQLRVIKRKVRQVVDAAAQDPENEELQRKAARARDQLLDAEVKEFADRVEAYPTDLSLRYELGRRYFLRGSHEEAIEQFQIAKDSPAVADRVRNMLAQSFSSIGWYDEAEATFRAAIENHEMPNDDLGLSLRYGLMTTLQQKAELNSDLAAAEEAFKLASGIAVQQINFRDIRERRQNIQELLKRLRSG